MILLFSLTTSCMTSVAGNSTNNGTTNPTESSAPLKAVYLTHGQGQLNAGDLRDHSEVIVIETFDKLEQYTSQKTALWIDKNATPLDPEQETWINEAPQAYYPIVLVGTSDTLYAFRDLLRLCCFMGPGSDNPGVALGFSVIQREQTNEPEAPSIVFLQGYDQKPSVQDILDITNVLLEEKVPLTPTTEVVPVVTATP